MVLEKKEVIVVLPPISKLSKKKKGEMLIPLTTAQKRVWEGHWPRLILSIEPGEGKKGKLRFKLALVQHVVKGKKEDRNDCIIPEGGRKPLQLFLSNCEKGKISYQGRKKRDKNHGYRPS